jgi:hypothetical protein
MSKDGRKNIEPEHHGFNTKEYEKELRLAQAELCKLPD